MAQNKPPTIIAICGPKRVGKDLVADYLVKKYAYSKIKIADRLKKCLKLLFNFSDEELESDKKDELNEFWEVSPRQVMQFFGTEMMQFKIQELLPNVGRLFWINSLISCMSTATVTKTFVISDLRFNHEHMELARVYGKDYKVIKIVRPSLTEDVTSQHESEQEYKQIPHDIYIVNDGTIEDLLIKLDNAMSTD